MRPIGANCENKPLTKFGTAMMGQQVRMRFYEIDLDERGPRFSLVNLAVEVKFI
jgi:hypothetical protein